MEKQQVFELSRHGEEFRIYIENMNRLDVMASLSKFLRGLADRKILDAEDILVCLLTGIDAKEMIDATDEIIRRLIDILTDKEAAMELERAERMGFGDE